MTLTGLAFMVVFLAAVVIALVRYPLVGLFAYVGEFYLHPPSRWWGAFLPDLRWSLLAAVVTLLGLLWRLPPEAGRERWFQTRPAKIMITFVAWFWLGWLWALAPDLHVEAGILITKYIVVFWLVYRLIDTPQKVTAFLIAHLIGCAYLGVLGLGADASGRLDGVGGPGIDDSNTLGMHLGTGVIVGAMLLLTLRGWRMAACIVAIALALNTLVLTGSRGAFLALVAGGAMLVYLKPAQHKRLFYAYGALGVLLFGYVASEQFWSRITTVTAAVDDTQTMDTSAESRIVMFKAQMKMAARYPWGAGHRASEVMSAQYLDPIYLTAGGARSSHNAFMTVLVEQGVPGAVMFVMMTLWVLRSLRALKQRAQQLQSSQVAIHAGAIGGSLVVVLIGGLFADFSKCEVQIWMFALLAAITQKQMYAAPAAAGDKATAVGQTPLPATSAKRTPARRTL
jgi:O-antigen ligase